MPWRAPSWPRKRAFDAAAVNPTLAVAGLSARLLAQAAQDDGFDVLALDLFGDADTRAMSRHWWSVGIPGRFQIDAGKLLAALAEAGRADSRWAPPLGWVAGSGLEGRPGLLADAAQCMPLVGCTPDAVARLRDPDTFFGFLSQQGIPHPPVARVRPVDGQAWLLKDLHACGASHIRLLSAAAPSPELAPGQILQRRAPGQAMSATFVANGQQARLLGVNRQSIRAHPVRPEVPYVFCGVVGPVPVAPAVLAGLQAALDLLVPAFGLRGLCSLDFLLHADTWQLLEVNPRPPASVALYPHWRPMAAHVLACLEGLLPVAPPERAPEQAVRGYEIVFARRDFTLDSAQAARLAASADTHDLPAAGQHFDAGDPLCSVTLDGPGAPDVLARLGARRDALLNLLETSS